MLKHVGAGDMEAVVLVDVTHDALVGVGQPSLLEKDIIWAVFCKKQVNVLLISFHALAVERDH